jgi:catechol 2,3-dioxygenase-like lactoylglutathione lyase family enzyme
MKVHGMNHFTILATDLEHTRAFYTDILGLKEGYRPPFGFPGIWFYAGKQPILHVIGRDSLPDPKGGVFDHMAYSARDLPGTIAKLKARGVAHDVMRQAGSRIWQVFFHDPNGAKIELDFAPEESLQPKVAGRGTADSRSPRRRAAAKSPARTSARR